jgi:hypothetical protein
MKNKIAEIEAVKLCQNAGKAVIFANQFFKNLELR